jgi:DNA-binding FadR family transcriptional regulator
MKNRRLFWGIVEKIEASINKGEYVPGGRLPPERELAAKFKVSRPTIREAIIALEVREKIEVKTGSGVYVIESNLTPTTKAQINAFELTQARALIEGEVAALAATAISDVELKELEKTLRMMKNGEDVQIADHLFHMTIAKATRNAAMIQSVENLWALRSSTAEIVEDYNNVCSKDSDKTLAEHTAIYSALKARAPSAARAAMHSHFNRLINTLFEAVETRALDEVKRKNSETRGLYSIESLINPAAH